MKEIRTIKLVEHTEVKFVADDGKEFTGIDAEKNCVAYERQKNKLAVESAFARLDAIKLDFPLVEWLSCESELWRIKLESKNDYFAMVDHFAIQHNYFDNGVDMPGEFPYTMTVVYGCECIYEYKNDLIDDLKKALEQLT